jgi:peptide/nickel transport system substrate-binding protein
MKQSALWALTLGLLFAATGSEAQDKVLRWSSAGDVQSIDPEAINETLTNNLNTLIYDPLVQTSAEMKIEPALASSWQRVNDNTWRVKLRSGALFHDGTPVTTEDVVFSVERAQDPLSAIGQFAKAVGHASRIDDTTVEFHQERPDPLFLWHLGSIFIMSRAWCIAHHVEHPVDYKQKQESFASTHENGSGPFILQSREPGVKTVYTINPKWWGHPSGNVTQVVFTPIANTPTRLAALLSGDVNFVSDPAPQDVARVSANPDIRVTKALERRVLFMGMDQNRNELLYSSVKGKNPFKDERVREAFYRAIDMDLIVKKIMHGEAEGTGCMTMGHDDCLDPDLEPHGAADVARAKALLAQAGYPNGFQVTLDCPNNRYVSDAEICQALVGMFARIGVTVELNAQPKTLFFPKVYKQDTSFFMYGWGGATPDAGLVLDPLVHSYEQATSLGLNNDGRFSDPELDRLVETAGRTMDEKVRRVYIIQALDRLRSQYYYLPLLRPGINWLSAKNVRPVILPHNWVNPHWFMID